MNREELRDEVRSNIRRSTSSIADTRINTWLDWSQQRIADIHTWEEMRKVYTTPTVADTKRYPFPTRMKDIFSLTLQDGDNSRKLIYVPSRLMDRIKPRPETLTTGRPKWYVDYGDRFELVTIPDAVYSLKMRCSIYPIAFASDTASSVLVNKDRLIVIAGTIEGYKAIKEGDYVKEWVGYYGTALQEALNSDHSAVDWQPVARGFTGSGESYPTNEYWKDPLQGGRL